MAENAMHSFFVILHRVCNKKQWSKIGDFTAIETTVLVKSFVNKC